jgi:hypothetical protein
MASTGIIGSVSSSRAGDVVGPLAAGEQAIVADAMEARGQHVHEKAADKLVCRERHALVALAPFEPVVRYQMFGGRFRILIDGRMTAGRYEGATAEKAVPFPSVVR